MRSLVRVRVAVAFGAVTASHIPMTLGLRAAAECDAVLASHTERTGLRGVMEFRFRDLGIHAAVASGAVMGNRTLEGIGAVGELLAAMAFRTPTGFRHAVEFAGVTAPHTLAAVAGLLGKMLPEVQGEEAISGC